MKDMDRLARSLKEQELQKYKQRYNQHRRESTAYFAGDLVWVQAQRLHGTDKLAPIGLARVRLLVARVETHT